MKKTVSLMLVLVMALSFCSCTTETKITTSENTIIGGSGTALAIPENNTETTIAPVYAVSVPFIVALVLCRQGCGN